MKGSDRSILLTCEHGGHVIPPPWNKLFNKAKRDLQSHRGWDKGALELVRDISSHLKLPLIESETSRLLIDLNRSLHHHDLLSEFTKHCNAETKCKIINECYLPYRNQVETFIAASLKKKKPVVHFSIHSFTPTLGGVIRKTDIGLLYDPKRKAEKSLCIVLQNRIEEISGEWKVRRNYPYRGIADGFTTHLRKKYTGRQYCGIEIEVNQKVVSDEKRWPLLKQTMIAAIDSIF